MLTSDPPHPYAEISAVLGIRIGSIGSLRMRCLERLRRSAFYAELSESGISDVQVSFPGGEPRA
jgi:hypothetical protein